MRTATHITVEQAQSIATSAAVFVSYLRTCEELKVLGLPTIDPLMYNELEQKLSDAGMIEPLQER